MMTAVGSLVDVTPQIPLQVWRPPSLAYGTGPSNLSTWTVDRGPWCSSTTSDIRGANCTRYVSTPRTTPEATARRGYVWVVRLFPRHVAVPCMAQMWWIGPIAETARDSGGELAFVVSGLLFLAIGSLERRVSGR